jgi:hypothetical protein
MEINSSKVKINLSDNNFPKIIQNYEEKINNLIEENENLCSNFEIIQGNQNKAISINLSDNNAEIMPDITILLEQNYKYYLEYAKLYEANGILVQELKTLSKEKNTLKHLITKLEVERSFILLIY